MVVVVDFRGSAATEQVVTILADFDLTRKTDRLHPRLGELRRLVAVLRGGENGVCCGPALCRRGLSGWMLPRCEILSRCALLRDPSGDLKTSIRSPREFKDLLRGGSVGRIGRGVRNLSSVVSYFSTERRCPPSDFEGVPERPTVPTSNDVLRLGALDLISFSFIVARFFDSFLVFGVCLLFSSGTSGDERKSPESYCPTLKALCTYCVI